MRKITAPQILVFTACFLLILALSIAGTGLFGGLPWGDFRGVGLSATWLVLFYLVAFVVYRIFLRLMPLPTGYLVEGSRGEFAAQVNILFYLVLFNFLIRTHFLPFPVLRLVHLALGARLGPNTFGGVLLDPPLTTVGANCIIGHDAVIFAHAIEGRRFALDPVVIGNDVTVGALAIVMAGVVIGDKAVVSAGAVVVKGTQIGAGEVWGGVPARCLRAAASEA